MTDEILIGELQKNQAEKLRVSLTTYNGHDLLNLRVWFVARDGEPKPTNKGLALNQRLIPELIRLLEAAEVARKT